MHSCRNMSFKLVFKMKHLQYIKFLGTVLGSSQTQETNVNTGGVYYLRVCLLRDIKWTCKQAKKIKKYFLIMCTIKRLD